MALIEQTETGFEFDDERVEEVTKPILEELKEVKPPLRGDAFGYLVYYLSAQAELRNKEIYGQLMKLMLRLGREEE